MHRFLGPLLFSIVWAPPARGGEAAPLSVVRTFGEQLLPHDPVLPSPSLGHVALAPRCEDDHTILSFLNVATGASWTSRIPGSLQALAWIDDRRYAVVRTTASSVLLDVIEVGAPPHTLDELPPPASNSQFGESAPCGLRSSSYRLLRSPEGLTLAFRRADSTFEVRRYDLIAKLRRLVQDTNAAAPPTDHQLLQVIPDPRSARLLLLWQNQPNAVPRRQLDLFDPGLGPMIAPSVRTVTHASDELNDCSFLSAERLLCHHRGGEGRGWLWQLEPAGRGQLLTRTGHAAAYALSPTQDSVAFVGSGGKVGPLVIQDLASGAQRAITLGALTEASEGSCEQPTVPEVHWLAGGQVLARGSCVRGLHVVATRTAAPEAAAAMAPPLGAPTLSPGSVAPAVPVRRVRAPRSGKKSQAAFWTPRF